MTSPHFVGFIKNTPEGLVRIKNIRKAVKNTGFRIVLRGRNEDRQQFAKQYQGGRMGLRQSIPCKFASYFALYLRSSDGPTIYDGLEGIKAKIVSVS